MVRPFVMWPNTVLKTPAAEVAAVDDDIRAIWDEMIEAMRTMPGGVGLAAPQLGIGLRLAVVDGDQRGKVLRMANPVILHKSIEMREEEEASPNVPGVSAKVKRPRAVTVTYLDETGMRVRKELVKMWATSVQHQIDHLDGKMYFHRLSKLKRDMLLKRAAKCA